MLKVASESFCSKPGFFPKTHRGNWNFDQSAGCGDRFSSLKGYRENQFPAHFWHTLP